MSDRSEEGRGVNILVLEGGGARGLSSLITLDQTMDRVQQSEGLNQQPNIGDHFDIVAGTGTGAVSACMIGRLRIPLKQAIKLYLKLAEVFSDRKYIGTSGSMFKASRLESVLKLIVRHATGDENARMLDARFNADICKTMVFAMSGHNMNAGIPCIFRSYQGVANQMPVCAIWEALCASMAHPDMFKSFEIGEAPMRESFVDGGLGCNNPISHVLAEAKTLYPNRHISSIISIGAGHARTIQIPKPSLIHRVLPMNVISAMKDIATDSERVAQEMAVRFQATTDVYFRFSVDQGMQNVRLSDWERLGEVTAHTRVYMRQAETSERMDRAVKAIKERKAAISMKQIDGQIQVPTIQQTTGVKICPKPSSVFTGQEDKIEQVKSCITRGNIERCVFVLHGLGGAGKTQISLKTIERTRGLWTDIVYVDATSRDTTVSTLEGFAKAKKIGESYKDTIRWLGNQQERWLLVFDNADDPSLGLRDFFPSGDHGSILITTRIPDLALLAQGIHSDCTVSSMAPNEALELLLKRARMEDEPLSDGELESAVQLLQEFGHLALAIVHAGAYIWRTQCTISHYRELFLKQRRVTLEKYVEILIKIDDYQKSVYTTWYISYMLLSDCAQRLLWLMAFLHHDNITEEMFRRAAVGAQIYKPIVPASDTDAEVHRYVKEYFASYLDSTGAWDSGAFLTVMTELRSYSLISYDRVNAFYALHVLVHDWAGTMMLHSSTIGVEHTTFLLAASIGYDNREDKQAFLRTLELHVGGVLQRQAQPVANNAAQLAVVYKCVGKWGQTEILEEVVVIARKQVLGEEHPETLTGMHNLALTYRNQGRYEQAETLQVQVVDASKRVLGEEHPDTLTGMNNLALTYQDQGRYEQAEMLQVQVVDANKRVLGEEHPETLTGMDNLALTYRNQGRYEQAETLQVQVVDASKRVLGEEHPDTLTSMDNLALTCQYQGRYEQAETLQVQVVDASKRVLGEEHPDTLTGMNNLALTYQNQGRYEQAETLQVQVVDARKRVLGEEHPDTLTGMNNLALTCQYQGRYEQAETLQVQVVEARKRVLSKEHPDTLTSMDNLALTCQYQGRYEQAETLQVQVVEARKRVLSKEHPDTLTSMDNLALTCQYQGRYEQAETLQVQVVEARKRVLGEEHPDTLTGMNNLALTYQYQGRYEQAETLLVQVVEARKRVLGEEHPETLTGMHNLAVTYQHQGRYEQAETLQVQVVDARKRVLGEEHPDTLTSMNNLASTYKHQGRYEQAETLQVQVVDASKRVLGEEHPSTLTGMASLASTHWSQRQYEQAEALEMQVADIRKRVLGLKHPDTLQAMRNLADTYQSLGQQRQKEYGTLQAEIKELERYTQ